MKSKQVKYEEAVARALSNLDTNTATASSTRSRLRHCETTEQVAHRLGIRKADSARYHDRLLKYTKAAEPEAKPAKKVAVKKASKKETKAEA